MPKLDNTPARPYTCPMKTTPAHTFFTPGRINLIGEHIDYNGGYVLPCTLSMGTTAVLTLRGDSTARFTSANFPELAAEIPLSNVTYDPTHDWANYPKGVLRMMLDEGHSFAGFDLHFSGNIPNGAGLSSSASIEVVTATALNSVFGLGYEMLELVKLAKRAENEFCGVNCGIMDQFSVGMGKPGHAVLLHCETLKHRHIPMRLGTHTIIIMNTNKRRTLGDSKYNERRAECEEALRLINDAQVPPLQNLAMLPPEMFVGMVGNIGYPILRARARHVITENARVITAAAALERGDIVTLGGLFNASHSSLRDDYQVSCRELDVLAEAAASHPACAGARMTGAGFGGCAIALVEKSSVQDFTEVVGEHYHKAIGLKADFYE